MDSRIYLQIMKDKGERRKQQQSDAETTLNVQTLVERELQANEELWAKYEFEEPVIS
jgi:hypothetical protein